MYCATLSLSTSSSVPCSLTCLLCPPQRQMLWDNLVDPDNSYNFGVELDAPLVRKKQLTTIRDEYHTAGKEEGENGGSPLSPPPGQFL